MPRARSPNRDKAQELWLASGMERQLKDIAAELGVSETQVRKWKSQDGWGLVTLPIKSNVTNPSKKVTKQLIKSVEENEELTNQQKEFCLHYVQIFNASQAAIRAGYSPNSPRGIGYNLLQNPHVCKEIARLKAIKNKGILASYEDLIDLYMRIAFADMGDVVNFGQRDVQVMGPFGPISVKDDDGKVTPIMKTVNYVDLNDKSVVDTSVIAEISQGKDGVKVKLSDRKDAFHRLEKFFDKDPDNKRRAEYEAKKLVLQERLVKVQEDKAEQGNDNEAIDKLDEILKSVGGEMHAD